MDMTTETAFDGTATTPSQTVDFDWRTLEEHLGEVEPDDFWKAADCLGFMLHWVMTAPTAHARFVRFVALASGLHPDKWPTMRGVAEKIDCVSATVSRASKKAEKQFGIHFIRSKGTQACEKMSERRKGGPSRRKKGEAKKAH